MTSSNAKNDSRVDFVSFTSFLGDINEAYYDFHLNRVCNLNKSINRDVSNQSAQLRFSSPTAQLDRTCSWKRHVTHMIDYNINTI